MVIHAAFLDTVQAHSGPVIVSATDPLLAAAPTLAPDSLRLAWQIAAPVCVTRNGCPAIVRALLRVPPLFALTVKFTVPLPVPDPPEPIVTQLSGLDAVQVHDGPVVTLTPLLT